jgi:hypothetical protein
MVRSLYLFNEGTKARMTSRIASKQPWRKRMKAFLGTQYDSSGILQCQDGNTSVSKSNALRQSFAEKLIQFVIRRPRVFMLVYGSGPVIVAVWLFISSVQNGEWIWASVAGSWLLSIVTCIGVLAIYCRIGIGRRLKK